LIENEKNEIEVHYLFLKIKISKTRHIQHFEFQYEFKLWDGHQIVNT